jgi:spermidine/putrescine-binding protein
MLDSWGDVLPMVSRYLGQPRLSAAKTDLDAVMAKLQEVQPFLRRISTAGYYQQLAEGELCLAIGYSGDAMVARQMVVESQLWPPHDAGTRRRRRPARAPRRSNGSVTRIRAHPAAVQAGTLIRIR